MNINILQHEIIKFQKIISISKLLCEIIYIESLIN